MVLVILILCVILGLPTIGLCIIQVLSWSYIDRLHNNDAPTKEEWKVKM